MALCIGKNRCHDCVLSSPQAGLHALTASHKAYLSTLAIAAAELPPTQFRARAGWGSPAAPAQQHATGQGPGQHKRGCWASTCRLQAD